MFPAICLKTGERGAGGGDILHGGKRAIAPGDRVGNRKEMCRKGGGRTLNFIIWGGQELNRRR